MKSEMYSKYAKEYDAVVKNNIYNAYLERPSLQALMGDVKSLDVLDLGCGSGIYAEYLIQQGSKKITCIDFSANMIELVKNKLGDRVSAYVQDLTVGLPKEKSNSADIIICPLVLHYIEDISTLFREVHRVLKVGGKMVFSTHHPFADFECSTTGNYYERELITQDWDTIGKPVSVTFYRRSLTELLNAVTMNGLVITELSEGQVSAKAKDISLETYLYLSKNPNFIFVKCSKA